MNDAMRTQALESIVRDVMWMARRYAHKRSTYAPGMVNEAIDKCLDMGIAIDEDVEMGMYADDGMYGTWNKSRGDFEKPLGTGSSWSSGE